MNKKILEQILQINEKLSLMEKKISKCENERVPGPRDENIPIVKEPFIPHDSYTYRVDMDLWYDFPRVVYNLLGAENSGNDYSRMKQCPFISFYSDVERDRYIALFKQHGIPFTQITDKDEEPCGTNTKSPVPSPDFRNIKA